MGRAAPCCAWGARTGELKLDALGEHERALLLDQIVLRLGEDRVQIALRQRLELDPDRKPPLRRATHVSAGERRACKSAGIKRLLCGACSSASRSEGFAPWKAPEAMNLRPRVALAHLQ